MQRDADIHQLFFWDLSSEGDPEPASFVGQGLEEQAAPLNVPLAGALTSHRDIQQLLHLRLHSEMCWLPLKQLHAGSQSGALLLWDALRMGFYSISASAEVRTVWMFLSFSCPEQGNCCSCGSAPNIQQRGEEKGGKSCGKQSRDGQRAGQAGGQPGTAAGWQGVPLSPGLPPISLGGKFPFCEGILGPQEAGRAASSPWAPQPGRELPHGALGERTT